MCIDVIRILVRRGMMLQNAGLVLSDGTTLDDLIDREMNEVSLRVMTDEELYRLEMERIFAKTWLLLGHESEIPKSGDFIVRDMGEDNVIVTRDRQGEIHVSLNVCPHRGMKVCLGEARSEEHTSELQALMSKSYAVFCLKKKTTDRH